MFASRRALALTLAIVSLAFGCEKKAAAPSTATPSAASHGLPPLPDNPAGAAAAGAPHPTHAPTGEAPALPPGHPAVGEGAGMPSDHPAPFDPNAVIEGVLRLDDKVKDKVEKGQTLFLVARVADPSGAPGAILAVKKLTVGQWPQPFKLDGHDAMMVGTQLSGLVIINARVDKDGDAITKNPGDVVGTSRPVEVPASKVVLTLDSVL
jgi:hypothetical protein